MRFSMCARIANTNMPLIQRSFFVLNARSIFAIFLCNWTQCVDDFSLLWQRYVRKGNAAKNPGSNSLIFQYRKNPVKCSACAVAQKIKTDFSRKLPISYNPIVRISRNLAKNSLETTQMIYHEKSEFWGRQLSVIYDLRWITKIAFVKILLEKCWQKGFNVNS